MDRISVECQIGTQNDRCRCMEITAHSEHKKQWEKGKAWCVFWKKVRLGVVFGKR